MLGIFLNLTAVILLSASVVFSQGSAGKSTADILKNTRIDVTSPEEIIQQFGKPSSDATDELDAEVFDSWLKIKKNEKVFRKLTYKKIGETEMVLFRFYENKLVKISFTYRKDKDERVAATDLPIKHNADFLVLRSVLKDTKISDFEGKKENAIPQVYPPTYSLISIQPDVVFYSVVVNSGFKALVKNFQGKPSKEMFPGYLTNFIVISRTLFNNQ